MKEVEVTTDTTEIHRIKETPESNYMPMKWTAEEMDKYLSKLNVRLHKEEMENINKLSCKYYDWNCDYRSCKNKSPGPDVFTGRIHQIFSEELILIFWN